MGQLTKRRSTKAEAKLRADNIRHHAESLWGLLLAAWENDDHLALGYETWGAYIDGEFDMSRTHAYRLVDRGYVTRAIEQEVGPRNARVTTVEVSARQAQVLRPDAPKAAKEIVKAVERGQPVKEAVQAAVAKRQPVERPRPHAIEPGRGQALAGTNGAAPAELLALLALDPTASGKHAGRLALASVRQARAWLDRFEGAIKGAQPIVTESACSHPSTRRIGRGCGACGKEKV